MTGPKHGSPRIIDRMRSRGPLLLAVGLVAGVIIGVTSYVIAAPSGGSVKVCVKSGVVVSSTNGKCPARAKLTKVNKRGPRGPAGPPGSPGGAPTATVTAEPSVIDGGTP